MSFGDQKEFLRDICPFCELDDNELDKAIKHITIGFYPAKTVLIDIGHLPDRIYMIIKGEVKAHTSEGELLRVYHAKETFDADALISGASQTKYSVSEDLICYELDAAGFNKLYESNEAFKQFYLMDMVERIEYLKKQETPSDLSSFMVAKVSESYLHEPCVVDENTSLLAALQKSVGMKSSSIVIKRGDEYGIVTDSDIKNQLASGDIDLQGPASALAHFPLISVQKDDFLFNVYLQLIHKNIKRIAVMEGKELVGMLEQIDILSYFANHSRLVTVKIEKAKDIESLKDASLGYLNIVRKLYAQGLKARYIAKMVSEINRKIFHRLFEMTLPEDLRNDCALIVMGSEGRGEQIIRTDQDNGLIIRDGVDAELYRPYMHMISDALVEFGYPKCPGNIMVSNPYWAKSESEYKKSIEEWILSPDDESFMEFSIFFDAQCVAGDERLLENVKDHLFSLFDKGDDVYMAYFARLTTLFETPVGFFSTFLHRDRKIDLKKAGIFPIVQGIRSLSLRYGIRELSTIERIKRLSMEGVLEEKMARELAEAFEILFYLRLGEQLGSIANGIEPDNMVTTDDLSKIQRDLLKDSLQIVEGFKKFIVRHFGLENLG